METSKAQLAKSHTHKHFEVDQYPITREITPITQYPNNKGHGLSSVKLLGHHSFSRS